MNKSIQVMDSFGVQFDNLLRFSKHVDYNIESQTIIACIDTTQEDQWRGLEFCPLMGLF